MKSISIKDDIIIINRELLELDLFVRKFLDVIKVHSKYLIVSGYVSICTGRSRATEDVDILISFPTKENFLKIYQDLVSNNFWCFQGDDPHLLYDDYVNNLINIRFSILNEPLLNMEVIFVNEKKPIQFFELNHPQKIKIQNFEFLIPPIEFEILFKELKLGSKKDIEDAKHLRTIFSDYVSEQNFRKFREIIQ